MPAYAKATVGRPIDQRKQEHLGDCPYPDKGKIYCLPQGIPYGILSYYSVRYLPNAEVLPQQQKADNIFNE
jgi:hypothetical protein